MYTSTIKNPTIGILCLFLTLSLLSCQKQRSNESKVRDHVYHTTFSNIRLGDGVPLGLRLAIRWRVQDPKVFYQQFNSQSAYDTLILMPRGREIAAQVSNTYPSVDSVFTSYREYYIKSIKDKLKTDLGESGITIKEVILSDIIFPSTFTNAMEQIAMKERELEEIRQKNISDIESANARKELAKANGDAEIEEAKVEGEVAKINAQIEKNKRLSKLAQAKTEADVLEIQAKAEARKMELLTNAELAKQRKLYNLDFARDTTFARLYTTNPKYATFLINRELASKVNIALVPLGTDQNMLSPLIQQSLSPNNQPTINLTPKE